MEFPLFLMHGNKQKSDGMICITNHSIANFVDVLSDLGEVSQEIIERAKNLDKNTLKEWTKLAAKSDTMQDFLKSIE